MIELVPGQQVVVIFKNMMQIEGYIIDCDNEIILESLDGGSDIIIKDPDVDIMMIKIIKELKQTRELSAEIKVEKNIEEEPEQHFRVDEFSIPESSTEEELKQKFEEVKESPNSELRLKTLGDLKTLLNKEEKKTISKKLNNYEISLRKPVSYEHGIFKK